MSRPPSSDTPSRSFFFNPARSFQPREALLFSLAATLLTVLLYVGSFEPWNQSYLQWVAFVPLFFAIDFVELKSKNTHPKKNVFLYGFLAAFFICAGGFYWVAYATAEYGGLPVPVAILLLAVFCLVGQMHIPIYLLVRNFVRPKKFFQAGITSAKFKSAKPRVWAWLALSGFVYAGIESLYPKLFLDTAGNAFFKAPWLRQGADIGGAFFLTMLIVLVNELITAGLVAWVREKTAVNAAPRAQPKSSRYFGAAVALVLALASYGYARYTQYSSIEKTRHASADSEKYRLALVQANIGDFLKIQSESGVGGAVDQVIAGYMEGTREAAAHIPKPDAIVWPETAYPSLFGKPYAPSDYSSERTMREFAQSFKGDLIFGGYDSVNRLDYNSIFFFDGRTGDLQIYHKSILLMFGETLPFADYFPSIKTWFPTMGFFGRGPGAQVFSMKNSAGHDFSFAPAICYEGLFPSHSAAGALLGADALLNVTNDSWFGPRGEPFLHLQITTYRSIETRLPMVRATNTGISLEVDTTGELINESRLFEKQIIDTEVSHADSSPATRTPYLFFAQWFGGNWFTVLSQLLLGLVILLALL
jgi:apolipoprotein N-acyltransferase